MPYAPGVQDMRGQLIGQGIQSFGQSIAQGLQDYQKNKIHNQALQGENEGIINALTQNPDLAKYLPQESQKLLDKKLKSGGLSLADSAKLNGYLTAGVKTYQMGKQMELQQAQIAETMAQARQREAMARQAAEEGAWMQRLQGGGDAQEQAQPMPAQGQALPQQAPQISVPESVQAMMQGGPQGVPQAMPQGQVPPPPQAVSSPVYSQPRAAGAIPTPNIDMLNKAISMGAPPHIVATLKKGADVELSQINEQRKLGERKINKIEFEKNGRTWVRTEDAMTKEVLGEAPVNAMVKSLQDEKDLYEFKVTTDSATKNLDELSNAAEAARGTIASIDRIEGYYAKGAESGFGQDFLTDMASAIGRATGRKDMKLADQQALQTELKQFALAVAANAKGAVSDYERKVFEQTVANSSNTPEANLAILKVTKKMAERTKYLQDLRLKLEDEDMPPVKIARAIAKARAERPLFDEEPAASAAKPKASVTAADLEKEFLSQKK